MPNNKDNNGELINFPGKANVDRISRHDMQIVLETNRKAIELESEIASQNEDILNNLQYIKINSDTIKGEVKDATDEVEDVNKELIEIKKDVKELRDGFFQLKVLLSVGLVSLIIQIIQIFKK